MGRGVSSGGGESSLGYLFGGGEAPKPAAPNVEAPKSVLSQKAETAPIDVSKQIPAVIQAKATNNYMRADGQNTSNFITDRPSTKVHAAPEGGSSLNYLFGGGSS